MRSSLAILILANALALSFACGNARDESGGVEPTPVATNESVSIWGPFVLAASPNSAALYLTLADGDGAGDRLTAVRTPAAGEALIHRTVREGGLSRMEHATEGIHVPKSGRARLTPGGDHVMLMKLAQPLAAGETIAVEIDLERSGTVSLSVPVISPDALAAYIRESGS